MQTSGVPVLHTNKGGSTKYVWNLLSVRIFVEINWISKVTDDLLATSYNQTCSL